jgi:hypothetical protein
MSLSDRLEVVGLITVRTHPVRDARAALMADHDACCHDAALRRTALRPDELDRHLARRQACA